MTDQAVACTLSAEQLQDRGADWAALARRALTDGGQENGRVELRFRHDPVVEATVRKLVALEERCCAFLDMSYEVEGGELALHISGPVEAEPVLDGFAALATVGD
jgi:hypothetical protein